MPKLWFSLRSKMSATHRFMLLSLVLLVLLLAANALTEVDGCASGFPDLNLITTRAMNVPVGKKLPSGLSLLKSFSCDGTLTSLVLGVDVRTEKGDRNQYPQISLWRPEESDELDEEYCIVTGSTRTVYLTPANFSTSGVFDYAVDPPLTFQTHDILGWNQPEDDDSVVRMYTIEGGDYMIDRIIPDSVSSDSFDLEDLEKSDDVLLLYPVFASGEPGASCSEEQFLSEETVRSEAIKISRVKQRDRTQRIFPDIYFSCTGLLTKWIIAGEPRDSLMPHPELQLWRKTDENSYTKTGFTLFSTLPNSTSNENVYEHILDPPLEFLDGDIFGLYKPKESKSVLNIFLQQNSGPFGYGMKNDAAMASTVIMEDSTTLLGQNDYPMVSVEIMIIESSSTVLTSEIPSSSTPAITSSGKITESSTMELKSTVQSSISVSITSSVKTTESSTTVMKTTVQSSTGVSITSNVEVTGTLGTGSLVTRSAVHHDDTTDAFQSPSSQLQPEDQTKPSSTVTVVIVMLVLIVLLALLVILVITGIVILRLKRQKTFTPTASINSDPLDLEVHYAKVDDGENTLKTKHLGKSLIKGEAFNNPTYEIGEKNSVHGLSYGGKEDPAENPICFVPEAVYMDAEGIHHAGNPEAENYAVIDSTDIQNLKQHIPVHVPTMAERQEISMKVQKQAGSQHTYSTVRGQNFFVESEIYWSPGSDFSSIYEQLAEKKYREISRQHIQIIHHLGSGQFGQVSKGVWHSPAGPKDVAIKMLHNGAEKAERVKFLQEAAIMGQFHHPYVITLHGVVTVGEPMMIVLELMEKGDLRQYLHSLRPDPGQLLSSSEECMLLKFCWQIASGMEYLSKKSFIHRDLAARNILVSAERNCKIADFGLSRDLMDDDYYKSSGGEIPVKWTAPEALLYKKYTTASDVWSFGVLMYEIWSLGHKPFENLTNQQAYQSLRNGYRLPSPPGCPRAIYQLMIQCWHPKIASRPSFSSLVSLLSQSNSKLLAWSDEDRTCDPQAAVLGAPLEAGMLLYPLLQKTYMHTQA